MKKFLFWLFVILISLGLIGISFWQKLSQQKPEAINEQIFPQNISYALSWGILVPKTDDSEILVNRMNDGDLIFYLKDSEIPKISITQDSEEITIGKWLYLVSAFDAYRNYILKNDNFSITHLSNGVYFVDTREELRIFSMSALLRVQLLKEKQAVNQIEVFPSEFFAYESSLGDKLVNADVFRVGQLATLSIADPFSNIGFARIFGTESRSTKVFFNEYQKYYSNRQSEIQKVLQKFQNTASNGLTKLDEFGMLFINSQKKQIILENSLASALQTMVLIDADSCDFCSSQKVASSKISSQIKDQLKMLDSISPAAWESGKSLTRKYITFGSSVNALHTPEYYGIGGSILTGLYQSTFSSSGPEKNQKVYKLLSDIYSQYYFGKKDEEALQKNLASYITFLVNSKSMGEREFLWFTYYLKEFLNTKGTADDANFKLFSQLIFIAQNYIESLGTAREKANMISIFLFTFNSISSRLETAVESRFFTGDSDDLVLKPDYLIGNQSNVPVDSVSTFDVLIQNQKSFLDRYKEPYMVSLGQIDDSSINYFTQLTNSNTELKNILWILRDYENYRIQYSLSDSTKWATGLVLDTNTMSVEKVTEYLKEFSGIDITTLDVSNDFRRDGFYQISVSFFGKPFEFELNPQGNIIQKMIYTETDGTKNTNFEQASISLTEREKLFRDQASGATTPQERERYNIYNFFKSILSSNTDTEDTTTVDTDTLDPVLTPQMQIFVQRNLIEKDFSIIAKFLPISIKNVKADIVNKEYDISLSNITAKVVSENRDYKLKISSDYIFQTELHAFENMKLQVSSSEDRELFKWQEVQILPTQINTVDLEQKFKKIWPLLEILEKHNSATSWNIQLDLDANSVIIWGISYTN